MLFGAVCVGTAWVVASRGRVLGRLASSEQLLRLVTDTAPQLIYYVDADRRYRFVNRPYAERFGRAPADIVGRHVAEVVSPERYSSIERHLTDALAGRRTSFELTRQVEGGVRRLHVTYVPDVDRGRTRGLVGVVHDVTDRKQAEDERARLLALEQARRREAEAIAELGRILTEGLDLDAVAQRIAELVRGLLRATTTTVYRVDPASRDFVCLAICGDMGPVRTGRRYLPRGAGVVGRAVERGRPVTSANVLDDPADRHAAGHARVDRAGAVSGGAGGAAAGQGAHHRRLRGRRPARPRLRAQTRCGWPRRCPTTRRSPWTTRGSTREAERGRREAELLTELAPGRQRLARPRHRARAGDRRRQGPVRRRPLAHRAVGRWPRRHGLPLHGGHAASATHERVLLAPGKGLAGEVLATGRPVRTRQRARRSAPASRLRRHDPQRGQRRRAGRAHPDGRAGRGAHLRRQPDGAALHRPRRGDPDAAGRSRRHRAAQRPALRGRASGARRGRGAGAAARGCSPTSAAR